MNLVIRPLQEAGVAAADRIFGEAFSKFLGLADPRDFTRDRALIATRWRADPQALLGAFLDDTLIGSCVITRWGSFGFIGPVSVRPDFWDKGVAKQLVAAAVGFLEESGIRQAGLFTFAGSPKHIALYQKFGFWPQCLTPVMAKQTAQVQKFGVLPEMGWREWLAGYSGLSPAERTRCLAECAEITDRIFPGLNVATEIRAITDQRLGETILYRDTRGLAGFACCHVGAGSEAGSNATFVKFAAVRPGDDAPENFARVLDLCEILASEEGCGEIVVGINTARHAAYRHIVERGFRTLLLGVAMLRPNEPAFNRPDCFVIDDLR
jgi:RimJ/RimL family protein N-acetyltransferase